MKVTLKNNLSIFSIIIVSVLLLQACSNNEPDPRLEEESFTKIYDNSQFNFDVKPLAIRQTEDKGYLILSDKKLKNSDYAGIYLLKVDSKGNFVKELEVAEQYVHPVVEFMEDQGMYYFFCMEEGTLSTHLAKTNENLDSVQFTALNSIYPLAAAHDLTTGNLVLLNYDHDNRQSRVSKVSTGGDESGIFSIDIGKGDNEFMDKSILLHFNRTSRHLPYQVGPVSGGLYFFNAIEDYTFSLIFTNFNGEDPVGVLNGQGDNAGISAFVPVSGSKFALAWFNFDENYLVPNATINTTSPTPNVEELSGYTLPEMIPYANVKIVRTVIDEKNTLVYGSDTRARQIGIYIYDEATGEFIGSKYLGFSNPFEIASITPTEDEGLAVCGTTYLAGRFPRICIFKLSKEELQKSIKR